MKNTNHLATVSPMLKLSLKTVMLVIQDADTYCTVYCSAQHTLPFHHLYAPSDTLICQVPLQPLMQL